VIRDGRIEHEVEYPYPPERVWRALVDSAELGAWLMPTDFSPEVGWHFTFDARPVLGFVHGEVLDVVPNRRLRCRWSGVFGDTEVLFELTPTESGTRLRLEHGGWADERRADRNGFEQQWRDKLTKDLRAVLVR
jgi:uncharacterized protein YndB with AHSA1/START domain